MNSEDMDLKINQLASDFEKRQIRIFRWLHQHPELAMQEFQSSQYILTHLRTLPGLEITHHIAKTGIKAVLRGDKTGPTIALRADFDALPVEEKTGLSYASKVKTTYNGQETFVSHACGHDANTAAVLGTATILSQMKDEIPGNVVFIFQPAEEGVPTDQGGVPNGQGGKFTGQEVVSKGQEVVSKGQEEVSTDQEQISTVQEGGAALMVKEGVLKNPDVQAIFALHTNSKYYPGQVILRSGVTHASMDTIIIKIYGSQAHGSQPWKGKDPILTGSAIVNSLQTIISRDVDLQKGAAVITVGYFHGGIKVNIIPEGSEMGLTVRSLNGSNHKLLMKRIKEVAELQARIHGCRAQVIYGQHYPLNENNPQLYQTMLPTVKRVAGPENVIHYLAKTTSEDFSYFSQEVPGLYIHFGTAPLDRPLSESKPNHHPQFQVDETSLKFATRLECNLILDGLKLLG